MRIAFPPSLVQVDGIVYLVDASDRTRFEESRKELDALLSDDSLARVPFLVLGNKIDLPQAASEEELRGSLGLSNYTTGKGKVREESGAVWIGLGWVGLEWNGIKSNQVDRTLLSPCEAAGFSQGYEYACDRALHVLSGEANGLWRGN